MLEKINGVFVKPEEIDSFHVELKTRALYYAKRKLGESFDKHESDLITVLNFAKDDFQFANDNLKKKAVAQFKQKMESCYDEYDSEMKKLSIKPQYNTDIQVKHNRCKDEAVDEYQKIEAEPLDEFRSIKSKLEEKIDNRVKLYEDQNTMHKKTEDQNEEQAWNDAESDFKLKIKKTMNKNSRTKSHKVRELYLEHTNELIREYRRKVPTRFYYKEEELKEKFKTIFEEEEEAGRCVVM